MKTLSPERAAEIAERAGCTVEQVAEVWDYAQRVQADQHSPGPWELVQCHKRTLVRQAEGERRNICALEVAGRDYGRELPNGRVIAAAPELLAACERLVAVMRGRSFRGGPEPMVAEELNDVAQEIREAVAKARGEA